MLFYLEARLFDHSKVTGSPPEGQRKVKVTTFSEMVFFVCKNVLFFFSSHLVGRQRRKKYSKIQSGRGKSKNRATLFQFI